MRKILFAVLSLVLSAVSVWAQEKPQDSQNFHRKMFVAGRTWNMMSAKGNMDYEPMVWDSTFTSFSIPKEADKSNLGVILEEGPKVYQDWGEGWVLVFDFSLNVGDNYMGLPIKSVDTIEVKGRQYRRLSFGLKTGYGKEKDYCWVEGIGSSLFGIYNGIYPPTLSSGITDHSVLSVYDGDELIFEEDDFMAPAVTAIKTVTRDESENSAFYDLQGRRLTDTPQRGVYIRGGRKYVVKE